jgi:hypothetical protein
MQKMIMIVAGISAIAGAAYLMLPRPSRGEAKDSGVEQLQGELQQLKEELRAQKAWTATRLMSAAQANEPSAALERGEEATPSEREQPEAQPAPQKQRSEEEMVQRLHENFDNQAFDRVWSTSATPLAQKIMGSRLPSGSKIRSVECRETTCRVETSHPDLDTYRKFMRDAFMTAGAGWEGPSMIALASPADASTLEAVAYLARPGADLVTMANEE